MSIKPEGPVDSRVMIVGPFPSAEDVVKNHPFTGAVGWELDKMLKEAGINRANCFLTHVVGERPPSGDIANWIAFKKNDITTAHVQAGDKWVLPVMKAGLELLQKEIEMVKPDIIIALGDLPLWALTEKWGIAKWRASQLQSQNGSKVFPMYHPSVVHRQYDLRPILVQDLRVAKHYITHDWPTTDWHFQTRPSFETVWQQLKELCEMCDTGPTTLSIDIETRAYHLACLGVSWTKNDAICIPFMELGKEHYWSESDEAEIVYMLYKLMTHPNARIVGQNFIYDAQYIVRAWHFIPNFARDTMLAHHVLFPAMQKSLDFICSMHNEQYVFWKDDGKTLSADHDEDKHWRYNCEDCVRTFEADANLQVCVDKMGLRYAHDFQMSLFKPVLSMMVRGVKVDREYQLVLVKMLEALSVEVLADIEYIVGYPLNPRSPVQMKNLFYEEMNQPKQLKRTPNGMSVSCDSACLEKVVLREPILKGLVKLIEDWRSIQVFLSTFLTDKRDKDGRMRCSYNIGGTYTFRFSSSENPFGSGLNMQNIPGEQKD